MDIEDSSGTAFHHRGKIPVAVLGATGAVGQRFVELLSQHPWFRVDAVCASAASVGKPYEQATTWRCSSPLDRRIAQLPVQPCEPGFQASIVFSALPGDVAAETERAFAQAGYAVVSNAKSLRMEPDVPLLIPEVNPEHLQMLSKAGAGYVVTNPNCSAVGISMALKVLDQAFGVVAVDVVTLQALSGAGFSGVPGMEEGDNVIPFIEGEEAKIETEPKKILGALESGGVLTHPMRVSATANRVPVSDGHMACLTCELQRPPQDEEQVYSAFEQFVSPLRDYRLPMAPAQTFYCFRDQHFPQPKQQRMLERGMAVSVGRVRLLADGRLKLTILSHNTIRGAAGAAILNAELLVKEGKVFW